jgi:AraC-like DNA-binding protein
MERGEVYCSRQKDYNQLFFILDGSFILNSNEGLGKFVNKDECFFLPILADVSLEALSSSHFMIFFFKEFHNPCERAYIRELYPLCTREEHCFQTIEMTYPLPRFFQDMITYFDRLSYYDEYHYLKCEELLYILRTVCAREKMAALFHPIVGKSLIFRNFVLTNYLKAKNVYALADMSGIKRKTFDRQFSEEFGETSYRWILKQKSKHIRYEISETDDRMQDIMRRYGFAIPPHFTRFCREYFQYTPLEYRRRLRMEKSQLRTLIDQF